jgi:ribonuclease D
MPPSYRYITTAIDRDQAISNLMAADKIGVDIEGDSLYHYTERVALIQISGNDQHFIFDPLLLDSVLPLAPLFENRSILKIFHGSEYDITSLKRDFQFKIGPIFDTALAARAIGMERWSLKELVFRFFNITLCKAHQKSNWSLRPLSQDQLDYACDDTVYLPELFSLLTEAVLKKGRVDQIAEECLLLENLTWLRRPFEPADYLRIKGVRTLPVETQKILRELIVARDGLAREKDLPPFKIAHDRDFLRLAEAPPKNEEEFLNIFSKGRIIRDIPIWLAAMEKGKQSSEPLPKRERRGAPSIAMTSSQQKLFAQFRVWRDQQARLEGVEAAMIMTTPLLQIISKRKPTTLEELKSVPILRKWQIDHYGEQVLKVVSSAAAFVNEERPVLPPEST